MEISWQVFRTSSPYRQSSRSHIRLRSQPLIRELIQLDPDPGSRSSADNNHTTIKPCAKNGPTHLSNRKQLATTRRMKLPHLEIFCTCCLLSCPSVQTSPHHPHLPAFVLGTTQQQATYRDTPSKLPLSPRLVDITID